jgi:oligopeptide transport system ATP-binding protein
MNDGGSVGDGQGVDQIVVVEHLSKSYQVGRQMLKAVDDVSFSIARGETLGLVGESGSGKSTIAKCVLGLTSIDGGAVRYRGQELHAMSASNLRQARRRMQVVFQDPHSSLNRSRNVEQIVTAPLDAYGIGDRRSRRQRAAEILDVVGLSAGMSRRRPRELSGGQAQRVAIARALALEPELVVLDEAVSSLDVSVRAQIMNLLKHLQETLGLTYLFISHDLAVVRYMSHSVAVMYMGRIVERGARANLFANPRHPYTHALMAAVPIADPTRERSRPKLPLAQEVTSALRLPTGCRFHPRCPIGQELDECRTIDPRETVLSGNHSVMCHHPRPGEVSLVDGDDGAGAPPPPGVNALT